VGGKHNYEWKQYDIKSLGFDLEPSFVILWSNAKKQEQ
jgi:hypothetical protein